MNENLLSTLIEQLNVLANAVDLGGPESAVPIEDFIPPQGTLVWSNSFSIMVLIPINELESAAFHNLLDHANEWIWRILDSEERQGRFIDGYILFALPVQPEGKLLKFIQEITLDTKVCRKHVIWPSESGDWSEQLWTVTTLGLPDIEGISDGAVSLPKLPTSAQRALKLYQLYKSYESVAEKLQEEAHTAARKEGVHDS